jgi:hypothetical protein
VSDSLQRRDVRPGPNAFEQFCNLIHFRIRIKLLIGVVFALLAYTVQEALAAGAPREAGRLTVEREKEKEAMPGILKRNATIVLGASNLLLMVVDVGETRAALAKRYSIRR